MYPTTKLITADNWALIHREYPNSVPIVKGIDRPYDAQLDTYLPGLRERVNELVMDWLKTNKQLSEKTVKEGKYQFQAKELKQKHHTTITDLQTQLKAATESAKGAAQQATSDAQKLKEAEENQKKATEELEQSQKVNTELEQKLASCQEHVLSLKEKNAAIQKELEGLKDKVCTTTDKVESVKVAISLTSRQQSQQQAVDFLNDPRLIENLTNLIELTKKLSHGLDLTKDFISDTLQAGKETIDNAQESVVAATMGVLDVAIMVAAVPYAVWVLYKQLNDWQQASPKARFNKLCQSINCDVKELTVYGFNYPICVPLNWVERVTGQYTQVVDVISYPTLHMNYYLRKKFPDFSCTFVRKEENPHARNADLKDCHSLEIINSNDLGQQYSIHDMHRYLKPNRVIKDESCMVMEGLSYNVWGLGLQDVKEVYLLVRFPKFISEFSLTSLNSSLIQKIYRHPVAHREGCGRDEAYSRNWLGKIYLSSDVSCDSSTIHMYSVVNHFQQQESLLSICELAIWEGIEVVGFVVHRHPPINDLHNPFYTSYTSCRLDNYFNWESIKPQERYEVLMRFLKVQDDGFAHAFNQRFPDYSCFYLGSNYVNPRSLAPYQLNQNIQLQLYNLWEIATDHIQIRERYSDKKSVLSFTVVNVEKIFLIADATKRSSKATVNATVSVNQMDRNQPIKTEQQIQINKNIGIYNVADLLAYSWSSHTVELKFPSDIKVKGFIFQ